MKDPEQLLSNGATEFELLVLRAARAERPSQSNRRRMRRALLLAELGFLTTSFKAVASVANQVLVVAVMAGVLVSKDSSVERPLPTPPAVAPVSAPNAEAVPAISAQRTEPATELELGARAPLPTPELLPDKPRDGALPKQQMRLASAPKTADLREEIRALDQARTAIRVGDAQSALSKIDRYLSQFPRGAFRQEAVVIRIEALSRGGNRARAAAEARDFIARHPGSPHVKKLERLAGESP